MRVTKRESSERRSEREQRAIERILGFTLKETKPLQGFEVTCLMFKEITQRYENRL